MMKKKRISLLYVLLIALLIFPMQAAADDQIQLDKTFTSFTPVFMSGHEGDLDWIEGFEGTGDKAGALAHLHETLRNMNTAN